MARMSVKLLRGVDLLAQDVNLLAEDSSDPYCEIYLNGRKVARTPTQNQTLHPIWGGPNATIEFDAPDEQEQRDDKSAEIVIKIYDQDLLKSDDPMGQVSFRTSAILKVAEHTKYPNVWIPVQSLDGCEASGQLQVRVLRLPGADDDVAPPPTPTGAATSAPTPASPSNKGQHRANQPPRALRESALSALSAGPKLRDAGIGNTIKSLRNMIISSRSPVTLHIYDVSNDYRVANFNSLAKSFNGGIYHAAVEIYGREYSFGGSKRNTTGIFACKPRKCPMHRYRESLYLGDCDLSLKQVNQILRKMKPEWMAPTYDLFRNNCCFFSREFVTELGVGTIPEWIYSLANVGAAIDDFYKSSNSSCIKEKKETGGISKVRPASCGNKTTTTTTKKQKQKSSAPEWGMPPTRTESELSIGSSKGKVKTADTITSSNECDHHADLVDHVMAARVQRAYRRSSIVNCRPVQVAAQEKEKRF